MKLNNFLIDPYVVQTVAENRTPENPFIPIQRDGGLQSIYKALSTPEVPVSMVEAVYPATSEYPDCIYVDEEARIKRNDADHAWFVIDGHPSPISGRGLVVGADEEGADADPSSIDMRWLHAHVLLGWRDYVMVISNGRVTVHQREGVHVLDQWADTGLIGSQRQMEAMGLATYGTFYDDDVH